MTQNGHRPNTLALLAGFGIGVTWIASALFMLVRAMEGFGLDRPDYGVAWITAGLLLLGAGAAAVVGTWWYQLRTPTEAH